MNPLVSSVRRIYMGRLLTVSKCYRQCVSVCISSILWRGPLKVPGQVDKTSVSIVTLPSLNMCDREKEPYIVLVLSLATWICDEAF